MAAEQEWRASGLMRLRFTAHGREVDLLAAVARLVFGPQTTHGLRHLAHALPAGGEVGAHDFGFFSEPAGADAEQEASAGIVIETCNRFGGDQSFALGKQADPGRDFEAGRHCGRHRQRDEGISPAPIVLRQLAP